jgi:hypothetical protein
MPKILWDLKDSEPVVGLELLEMGVGFAQLGGDLAAFRVWDLASGVRWLGTVVHQRVEREFLAEVLEEVLLRRVLPRGLWY